MTTDAKGDGQEGSLTADGKGDEQESGVTANGTGRERATGAKGDEGAELQIVLADYADVRHARDLVALLDGYARDPMGGGEPLDPAVREALPAALAATSNAFTLLAYAGDEPVALANCFTSLSTFAARPIVNVHDLAVAPGQRGRGVGRSLLAAVVEEARARGACKVTLEVLEGNAVARRAYERAGFRPYVLDETVGGALFLQRTLDAPAPG